MRNEPNNFFQEILVHNIIIIYLSGLHTTCNCIFVTMHNDQFNFPENANNHQSIYLKIGTI